MTTDLLERAHNTAYRFPVDFAGFTAEVRTSDGDAGVVTVRGRRDLTVDFGTEAGGATWAREQLASILGHRWATRFADGDGRFANRAADTTPGGTLVQLDGDPMASAYRVKDDEISEVHRTMGDTRFTIVVSGSVHTDEGRLPNHFSVYYWHHGRGGRLVKCDQYRDAYANVSGVWLPIRRTITTADDDGLTTRVLELESHEVAA